MSEANEIVDEITSITEHVLREIEEDASALKLALLFARLDADSIGPEYMALVPLFTEQGKFYTSVADAATWGRSRPSRPGVSNGRCGASCAGTPRNHAACA
jgi:hypothetical protein